MVMDGSTKKFIKLAVLIFILVIITTFLFGCTISMQNTNTHGIASDLIDEQQEASPDVNFEVPDLSPLPKLSV
jgi:hypothetical protein